MFKVIFLKVIPWSQEHSDISKSYKPLVYSRGCIWDTVRHDKEYF